MFRLIKLVRLTAQKPQPLVMRLLRKKPCKDKLLSFAALIKFAQASFLINQPLSKHRQGQFNMFHEGSPVMNGMQVGSLRRHSNGMNPRHFEGGARA